MKVRVDERLRCWCDCMPATCEAVVLRVMDVEFSKGTFLSAPEPDKVWKILGEAYGEVLEG